MEKIENLPKITADYFIPLGPACRPAYWLQRTGLRQCSLPFDWLGLYDLNLIVRTLHEGVRFWFETYTETEPEPKTRVVVNETINLRSRHAFPKNQTVDEYLPTFYDVFERRNNRFRHILETSKHVCFICNRGDTVDNFSNFADQLHEMYPHLKMTFINVIHNDTVRAVAEYKNNDYCTIYTVTAYDIHPKGGYGTDNPLFWHGNLELWSEILSNCKLSHDFQSKLSPIEFRCDIKNYGGPDNNVNVTKSSITPKTPKWLQNDNGGGIVFSGKVKSVNAQIIAVGDGTLKFIFRGPDMRVDGKRVQLWIDYSSIKIDGAEVLSAPISTWHNKPFIYEMPVTNGQVITLEFTQTPHKYSDEELNALLNTLKNNPLLVETDIKIIRDFYRKAQQSD